MPHSCSSSIFHLSSPVSATREFGYLGVLRTESRLAYCEDATLTSYVSRHLVTLLYRGNISLSTKDSFELNRLQHVGEPRTWDGSEWTKRRPCRQLRNPSAAPSPASNIHGHECSKGWDRCYTSRWKRRRLNPRNG